VPIDTLCAGQSLRGPAVAILAALLVCGLMSSAVAAATPGGPPPGYARIWVYRLDEPYVSLDRPYVRFNGRIVAISELGGAFYRDVPPGEYYVTVDSEGRDINQFVSVGVMAGQQIYIEVQALQYWDCGSSDLHNQWCRPTFYTRLQVPQIAAATIAHSRFYGGS
jgi:hypothetical protein